MKVLNSMWMLPRLMVKNKNMDSSENERTKPRRRPLHTCTASAIAIAQNISTRAQQCNGPIGSISKRAIKIFNFFNFIQTILHQFLAVLSLIDDYILVLESFIERVFPPSKHLFDEINELVNNAEAFPEKMDDTWRKFPEIIHKFPFLDWILAHLISWSSFFLSRLLHYESKTTREKDISVDTSFNHENPSPKKQENVNHIEDTRKSSFPSSPRREYIEPSIPILAEVIQKSLKRLHSLEESKLESPTLGSFRSAASSPLSDSSQEEWNPFSEKGKVEPFKSYKDVVKSGVKKVNDDEMKSKVFENENGFKEKKEGSLGKDQKILELFDAGWSLK